MIDRTTIEGIKSAVDLRTLIGPQLENPVQQPNGSIRAACPFPQHKDSDPSFFVHQNFFKCFGCNRKGDVYSWYEMRYGKDFPEAAKEVAETLGFSIGFEDEEKVKNMQLLYDSLNAKAEIYMSELWENEAMLEWLCKERNLDESTIATFQLGFAKEQNAISIPFFDNSMRVVNIVYRSLEDNDKYKYFYDTEVRDAGKNGIIKKWNGADLLFNEVSLFSKGSNVVYVTEGMFDVMSLSQLGLSAVGYHGNVISDAQIRKIRNTNPVKVVFCPDNKKPNDIDLGYKVAEALKKNLDCPVKIVWSDGDVNNTNQERMKSLLTDEKSPELAFLDVVLSGDIEEQRIKAKSYIKQIDDPLARDDVVAALSSAWGKPKNLIENFLNIEKTDKKIITVSEAIDRLEELATRDTLGKHITHRDFGEYFEPLGNGHLATIAARTNVGKTLFMLNLLGDIQLPAQVLFISLEQPITEIMARLIAIKSEVYGEILNPKKVKKLVVEDDPPGKWLYVRSVTQELLPNVHFYDGTLTVKQLSDIVRVTKDTVGENLIVMIDYLGLLKTDGNIRNEYEKATRLAYDMQETAKELDVLMMYAHQMNRGGGSGDEKVSMDMLRGSGVLEETTDLLLGLYKDEQTKDEFIDILSPINIDILKNRHGPLGHFEYILDKRNLTFKRTDDPEFVYQSGLG